MSSNDRYAEYVHRHGGSAAARAVEDPSLALGAFHLLLLQGAERELRAAVSPAGVVGGTRDANDAWWELLGAGDAGAIADRIAWLESTPDASRHVRGHRVIVVRAGERLPTAAVDPELWRRTPAPVLHSRPDQRELVCWLYTAGADEPVERTIRAHPTGPAEIVERPAHDVVALGDPTARAIAALASSDVDVLQWALLAVTRAHAVQAALAVAKLLGHANASVRGDTASTLAELADPRSVDPLAAAARRETDATAQLLEVEALGALGPPAADALAALGPSLHGLARAERIHALNRIGRAAREPVRRALADAAAHEAEPELRQLAAAYLKALD